MARVRAALFAASITVLAVTLLLAFRVADTLELPARDLVLRLLPSRDATATAVVAIDEPSLQKLGPWPWRREVIAQLVDRAAASGARAAILDILLADPAPGDDRLAAALRKLPSIAVAGMDGAEWRLPVPPLRAAAETAHGNFELDHDGIARRIASTKQSRTQALTALSVEAASIVTARPVPVGVSIVPMFRTRPRAIPIVSAAQLLQAPMPRLRGTLLFLGPTAIGLGDRVLTPVSAQPDPGVTVHAAATESIIRGEVVREVPPIGSALLSGAAVASILLTRRPRLMSAAIAFVVIGAGMLLLAITGIAIPFITLLVTVIVAIAGVETVRTTAALRQSHATVEQLTEDRAQQVQSKRVLAHELKTPLASMRGLSQLLAQFDLNDAERRRVATLLESEAGKLQSMVTGLLDLEGLSTRDFESSSSVIDLGDLVAARVEFLRASSDREMDVIRTPRLFVRADAALIERVLDNLVGNAVKYTPQGSPIAVTVRRESEQAIIEVEDRGRGISESDRQRIFDRFFRGSSAAGTAGLGLGLSLVAEVARWHRGSASVHEGAGGGALFRFALPLAQPVARAGGM
jgi:signal transduction histidine kinase